MNHALLVHPNDDMVVALRDHRDGDIVSMASESIRLTAPVAAKHKFARRDARKGERLRMYGLVVAEATRDIFQGEPLTTSNLRHATGDLQVARDLHAWHAPDVSPWSGRHFEGYVRADRRVGTRNYWIVVPLVFCQNRNVDVLRESLVRQLGYARPHRFHALTARLIDMHQNGSAPREIRETSFAAEPLRPGETRLFPEVDGIKFLVHDGGCGGLYEDAQTLCGLLAGYITHPNVAGATVLSLGCQKSQVATLESELHRRDANLKKPIYIFEQQREGTEETLLDKALKHTFAGLIEANKAQREPAAFSALTLGVECGGSDGFSGISANPAIGQCSDLLVGLQGTVILSEFPELAGCENDLTSRCTSPEIADRFLQIMRDYQRRTTRDGGGFDHNPSPGNVRDGLITDAMKSAGAAKKGGTSPVVDVLDYPEPVHRPGLNLLCTPGGDVESTTAMAGSGANIQVFSTGLGTPTGNPITPVLKISSNTLLAERMPDIIDLDAGGIISDHATIQEVGARLFDLVVETASGDYRSKAEQLGQDDFIPWKRGITF